MHEVERALAEIAAGHMVIVLDDADRENEGDLVAAADAVTPQIVAAMATDGRGLICAPITAETAARLELPPMVVANTESHGTAFTVSVDAAEGVTTGISAADRAHSIGLLADGSSSPQDFARPGHVFPLVARPGGVLERMGHTEAGVDLARLAGRAPAAVICEMLTADGEPRRPADLRRFAQEHGLALVTVAQIAAYRRAHENAESPPGDGVARRAGNAGKAGSAENAGNAKAEKTEVFDGAARVAMDGAGGNSLRETDDGGASLVNNGAAGDSLREVARADLPTADADFRAVVFADADGAEHLALVLGDIAAEAEDVLVRVHSECLTGEALGSLRCDCGPQLAAARAAIAAEGRGVLIYLRGHEGRGTGLAAKIRAYGLQDHGMDTVDANLEQGLPADARDYTSAPAILSRLGVRSARIITNNPEKAQALSAGGIRVLGMVPAPAPVAAHNLDYLRTKAARMGHHLPWLPAVAGPGVAGPADPLHPSHTSGHPTDLGPVFGKPTYPSPASTYPSADEDSTYPGPAHPHSPQPTGAAPSERTTA